jgi:hypothetical protein
MKHLYQWLNKCEGVVASVAFGLGKMGIAEFLQTHCLEVFTKNYLTGSGGGSLSSVLSTVKFKILCVILLLLGKSFTSWVKETGGLLSASFILF